MNVPETLFAASRSLRGGAPRDAVVADWLDAMSHELQRQTSYWRETGQPVAALTGALYRWPLKVARAVLDSEPTRSRVHSQVDRDRINGYVAAELLRQADQFDMVARSRAWRELTSGLQAAAAGLRLAAEERSPTKPDDPVDIQARLTELQAGRSS